MKIFCRIGKIFLTAFVVLAFGAPLFAEITFSSPNLNEENEVLFALSHKISGSTEYSTVFKSKIKDGKAEYFPEAITCFPERLAVFDGARKLLIRNRYGRAIYDFGQKKLQWISRADLIPENAASPLPAEISATGKWYCCIERKDVFKGRLVVIETASGRKIVLNEDSPFSYSNVPVKWSPDGKNFLYEKGGVVYFCNPEMLFKSLLIQEEFRRLGDGTIHNVTWNDTGIITYISKDLIFQIDIKELFTLGLYNDFIQLGKIVGRLPQKFDGLTDRFWVDKNGMEYVVIRGDEVVSYYRRKAKQEDGAFVQILYSCSFAENEMTPLRFDVFWTEAGEAVLCAKLARRGNGRQASAVYTISANGKMTRRIFVQDTHNGISVGPDKMFVAITTGENTYIYSIKNFQQYHQIKGEKVLSIVWRDNGNLILGGVRNVAKLSLADNSYETLFASSGTAAGWNEEGEIVLDNGVDKERYVYNEGDHSWRKEDCELPKAAGQNPSYRVFCGSTRNARFANALYVRTLKGDITTKALVAKSARLNNVDNQAALVFDADENPDGLNAILAICHNYGIRCNFFFNGEFVRRYPEETREISKSGHECAAIFFNNIDLTNKFVYSDPKYVSKGLARLEDEFFQCTGQELSLFWHAPFNKADEKIKAEGAAAGYHYIDFDDPRVIAISAGKNVISGALLYEKFDLIINEIFATGADVVTLSRLK
ncbi:MAG: polysaccharide deacetylase family protein [Treponema sp.]|nr:polysaccharide deacetylase family protein [Treponema sp.]